MSVDHLVIALRVLDVSDWIEHGLLWIERVVNGAGGDCASTSLAGMAPVSAP